MLCYVYVTYRYCRQCFTPKSICGFCIYMSIVYVNDLDLHYRDIWYIILKKTKWVWNIISACLTMQEEDAKIEFFFFFSFLICCLNDILIIILDCSFSFSFFIKYFHWLLIHYTCINGFYIHTYIHSYIHAVELQYLEHWYVESFGYVKAICSPNHLFF